jgi:hypothetical protein
VPRPQWLGSWADSCTNRESWQVGSASSLTSSPRCSITVWNALELEKEHIEAQNHHLRLQRIHDELRFALDAGLACVWVAQALLLGWAVWTAARSE